MPRAAVVDRAVEIVPEGDRVVGGGVTGTSPAVDGPAGRRVKRSHARFSNKRYEREYRDAKVAVVAAVEWDAEEQEAQCSSKPSYVAASEPINSAPGCPALL